MDKETSSGRSEVDNSIKKSILCTGDRTKISGIGCVGSARQPLFPISETVMNAYTSTKNLDSEFYRSRSKSEQGSLRKGGHRFRDLYKVSCCEKFQHNSSRVSAARSSSSKAFSSQQFCAYAVKDELKGQMRESEKISQHSKLLELDDRGDLFQCGNAKADIEISVDFASGDVEEEAASETSGTSSGPESERDVSSYETSGILCCAPTAIDCGNPSSSRNALIAKLDQMTAPSMSHTQAVKRVLSQVQDGYPSRQRPNSKELEPVLHHEIQLFSRTRHVRKSKAEQIHAPDGSNFRPPFHHDIDGAIPQVKNFPGATMVSEKFLSSWIKIMSPGGLDHKYLTTRSWLPCGASQKSQTYPKIEVGSDQFQKKYWGTNKSRCAAGKSHAKEPLNNIAASVFGSAVSGSTLKTALWHLPAMNLSKSELGPEATRAAKDWGVRMTTQEKLGSPEAQAFECHGYLTPMCRPPAQHSRPKFQWSPEGSLFSRKLEMDVQSSEQCPGDNNQTSNEDRDLLCRFSSDCVSPSEVEKWKDVEQLVREQKLQNEELRAQIRAKDRAIDAARTEAEMGFTILKDAELNLDRMRRENRRLTESLVENGKVVSSISFECENAKEEIRKQELRRKGCEVELQKMEVILTNCGIKMQNVEHERRIEGRALAGALKLASNTEQSKNDTLVETSLGGDRFGGVEKSDNSPVRAFTMGDRHEELEHFWITENQQSSIEKVMLLQTLSQNLKRKVVQLHGEIKVMKGMITDEGDKLFGRNGRKLTDAQGKQIVISACKESDYSAKNAGFSIFKPQMGQRKGQIPGCRRKVAMLSSEHDRTDVLLQVFDTRVSESSTTWPMKVGTEGATFESDDAPENIVDLIPRPSQIGRVCNFIKNDTRDSRPVLCLADQSESCFPQHAQLIDKRGPQKINGQDVCQGEVQQYQFQQRRYDQFLQFDQLQVILVICQQFCHGGLGERGVPVFLYVNETGTNPPHYIESVHAVTGKTVDVEAKDYVLMEHIWRRWWYQFAVSVPIREMIWHLESSPQSGPYIQSGMRVSCDALKQTTVVHCSQTAKAVTDYLSNPLTIKGAEVFVINDAGDVVFSLDIHITGCNDPSDVCGALSFVRTQIDLEELVKQEIHRADAQVGGNRYYVDSWPCSFQGIDLAIMIAVPHRSLGKSFDIETWFAMVAISVLALGLSVLVGSLIGQLSDRVAIEMRLRNELFQQLEKTRRAEASRDAKTAFLSHMSHELRTPMACIIGLLESLLGDLRLSKHESSVKQVHRCATALVTLLNSVLDIAKDFWLAWPADSRAFQGHLNSCYCLLKTSISVNIKSGWGLAIGARSTLSQQPLLEVLNIAIYATKKHDY